LSVANSFLNYLEKKQDNGFTLIDRQKLFEIVNVAWDSDIWRTTGYTKKTTFNIKLRINL
jgi:hypothetical protein